MYSNKQYHLIMSFVLRHFALGLFLLFFNNGAIAQLSVNNTYTVQTLVQNYLLGAGVYASNITYTGSSTALGYFNGKNTNLGIDSGIVFSTGDVTKIANTGSTFISTSNKTNGDADLENLVSSTKSQDAAIIEFDFYTFSNKVSFKYVFGSEEYPNYSCNPSFNDAFGFFISGPGITGKQNIALVPGTSIPVSINNIHGATSSCTAVNAQYYVDNTSGTTIAFNAFTTVLEATSVIEPCKTYHIKLVIADFADANYDSGVFLEAQSFNSGVSISAQPSVNSLLPDSSLYEGCGYSTLYFTKSDTSSSLSTYYLTYSGSASNGIDYVLLPDSIVFTSGQDSVSLILAPLNDAIAEGTETVSIEVSGGSCATNLGNINLTILDHPNIITTTSNDTIIQCPTDSILVNVSASGGAGTFTYVWENGDSSASIYVSAQNTNTYRVTAYDQCGIAAKDSTTITIKNYSKLGISLPNDTNLCSHQSTWIKASVTGGKAQYVFSWEGLTNTSDSVLAQPDSMQTFIVTVSDSCGLSASDTINVTALVFVPSFSFSFVSNFDVNFTNLTSNGTVIAWDFGTGDFSYDPNPTYTFPDTGTYNVQMLVQNQLGCIDTISQIVIVQPEFNVFIPNSFSPNDDNINDLFGATVTASLEYHMQIFDRWGKLLYQSNNINNAWNGNNINGDKCSEGIYTFAFQIIDKNGYNHSRMGTILLMR